MSFGERGPMNLFDLLVIDPQNDFLDIQGAALPVSGAHRDMQRLADWLQNHALRVQSITVTLDSHASVGIERTTFWLDSQGEPVPPFTQIRHADVVAGTYRPRHAVLQHEVLRYLEALESQSRRTLVVWPVHCVLGTWGHNIHQGLAEAIAHWEVLSGKVCHKVIKGQNPLTEQYSAFRAEVPRADDPRTRLDERLMHQFAQSENRLLVAGEALSHCVAASVSDLMEHLPPKRLQDAVLLRDCMSPVPGFEAMGQDFLERAKASGMSIKALQELD